MCNSRSAFIGFLVAAFSACAPASAVEGPSAAGPIGGTDIRSANLPPPGLYGGAVVLAAVAFDFVDGHGNTIPALSEARLTRKVLGPFLLYVPDYQLFGGSIALGAFFPVGEQCGRLFAVIPKRCQGGFGDPYVELAWSRSFATPRPSRYPNAFPILEGLTIGAGFGVVIPIGQYNASDPTSQALSNGSNIWDFAPNVAVTYTTRPIIAEGTEFSAKLYWNNYLKNPTTQYSTGSLLNLDFAVSERIGRFQVGVTGFYAVQVADDRQFGIPIAPDGRRVELLSLGGVVNYDMPEYGAVLKIKAITTALAINTVRASAVAVSVAKKLW